MEEVTEEGPSQLRGGSFLPPPLFRGGRFALGAVGLLHPTAFWRWGGAGGTGEVRLSSSRRMARGALLWV